MCNCAKATASWTTARCTRTCANTWRPTNTPQRVEVRQHLPMTTSGKVLKRELLATR